MKVLAQEIPHANRSDCRRQLDCVCGSTVFPGRTNLFASGGTVFNNVGAHINKNAICFAHIQSFKLWFKLQWAPGICTPAASVKSPSSAKLLPNTLPPRYQNKRCRGSPKSGLEEVRLLMTQERPNPEQHNNYKNSKPAGKRRAIAISVTDRLGQNQDLVAKFMPVVPCIIVVFRHQSQ